jgi:hypothetical protein
MKNSDISGVMRSRYFPHIPCPDLNSLHIARHGIYHHGKKEKGSVHPLLEKRTSTRARTAMITGIAGPGVPSAFSGSGVRTVFTCST